MKRFRGGIGRVIVGLFALVMLGALGVDHIGLSPDPAYAQGGPRHHFSIIGTDGQPITNGRCRFLTAGTNTNLTIYTNRTLATTTTNPATIDTTSGACEAFLPDATDTIDVIVYVDGGSYKGAVHRADAMSRTSIKKIVVAGSGGLKHIAIPFPAASASAQSSTLTLPRGALITRVLAETTTAVATSTTNLTSADSGAGTFSGRLCNAVTTGAVGFADCAPATLLMADSSSALRVHNTNHETGGFFHVYYVLPGNEP